MANIVEGTKVAGYNRSGAMCRHDSGCNSPEGECSGACMSSSDANVEVVRQLLLDRSKVGLAKYGVTTMRSDLGLPEWLKHLQEELLDASVYVQATQGRLTAAEALIRLLRSYNPDLPMGPGMKAQFLALREVLDV